MYSIGEFSRRTQLSIRTLRLYDREGLLKPALVDAETGYRYYQPTQILAAEEIRFLRDCDLPLETIARLRQLRARGADREILGILEGHEPVIQEKLSSMQKMQRWIRSLRLEIAEDSEAGKRRSSPDAGIEVVKSRSRIVVATRKFGNYGDVFPLIEELTDFALSNGLRIEGPPMLLWGEALSADRANPGAAAEVEVAMPVSGRFASTTDLLRRRLAAGAVARLMFRGERTESGLHYERLFSWVRENDCEITGAFREIYHNLPGTVEPAEYLTELQVPINLQAERYS
jgi:DNA-binding transcriptional MerR regulator